METNDLINQVIRTIRADILNNKEFLKEILSSIKLSADNIEPQFYQQIMSQLNVTQQAPQPGAKLKVMVKNPSKIAAQPIVVGVKEASIISDLLEGNNVYLMGKAGTGKTYIAEAIPPIMGQPKYIINCSQWTSPIEIRGGQTIDGYVEGELIKAWTNGGILILDELPKLDPNTAGLLNDALSKTGIQPKYDENGNVIERTVPTITNGKGESFRKGQFQDDPNIKYRFSVIATGNTNLLDVGNKYGGNQRQDYSLVDRFAGSFYTIGANELAEKRVIYPYVFNVCNAMRKFLNDVDAVQSISFRTMANFNRTYEQEMLYALESPFADEIYDNAGRRMAPKKVDDSINSFLDMMEKNMRDKLENDASFKTALKDKPDQSIFKIQFMQRYHIDPISAEPLTDKQIEDLGKSKFRSDLEFVG